jgi:hypothetical protein
VLLKELPDVREDVVREFSASLSREIGLNHSYPPPGRNPFEIKRLKVDPGAVVEGGADYTHVST